MSARPSISVVTPCMNAAATISETLASVATQDYAPLEHIVVDGGSTDGTLDLLRANGSVRWTSEPDEGLSDAVNKGVAMARGDVIGWINADDVYRAGALGRVADAFAAQSQALWAFGRCAIIGSASEEIRPAVTAYKNFFLRHWSLPLHLTHNFVSQPSTFFRRDAFEAVGGLDKRYRYSMDYDLWLRFGEGSAPIVIDEELAAFRMQEGTLSMTGFEEQFAEHLACARAHQDGHRGAVMVNSALSRAIVLTYRGLALLRSQSR
jgi:glycosyltransferase involved in cell wall biosynthesis